MSAQRHIIWLLPLLLLAGTACRPVKNAERALLEGTGAILHNDVLLRSTIRTHGPKEAMRIMRQAASFKGVDCHNRAHQLGRMSYEDQGNAVFKLSIPECHSGFYHGAIEAFFRKHGTANLAENLTTICTEELNGFFTHQCIHGIGHGLMAWSDYALPEALEYCNLLPNGVGDSSCRTGVFMENIVGSLDDSPEAKTRGHVTRYVSSDPHYPCTIVKEEYKADCYFLQTDRMLVLSKTAFDGVARNCEEAPEQYQISCFGSMGRTIGGRFRGNPEGAIAACKYGKEQENRLACILGAAQDTFWDASGENLALAFCEALSEEDGKADCYREIIRRSQEILTAEQQAAFCLRLPSPFAGECPSPIPS